MSRPKSYKFALRSMTSNYNGNFEAFQAEAEKQIAELKDRIGYGRILVNDSVRIDLIDIRTMGLDDSFLAVFEVINEYSYKIVTSDDAHTIKNELLKDARWFVTDDESPITIGR